MAVLNYDKRLLNIQSRKFDNEINESRTSKLFSDRSIPQNVKYLFEAMKSIEDAYNQKTHIAANRVQKHLEEKLDLHFNRAYKTQGSVMTATNIKVHSDFDLLTIIDRYHYTAPNSPNQNPYTQTNPNEDIEKLRKQSIKILKNIYDEVDDSGSKSISIFNKSLNRKVDIVFCFWYNSAEYEKSKNEYYRGIYLFDFPNRTKILDYPFAHLQQVNDKGDNTTDGSRKGIRLLKNLKADTDNDIKLSSFHLTSIVHSIDNNLLNYNFGSEIKIASSISAHLNKLISFPDFRKSIKSPNGTENPFEKDDTVKGMKAIKDDLDALISDTARELNNPNLLRELKYY